MTKRKNSFRARMPLEVVYEDEEFIAINKPHGLLVHRTKIASNADEYAIQLLRDQIGLRVYPAHRLDRKTSGVLLFSKSKTVDSRIQQKFMNREVEKTYLAIVRGWQNESLVIDYPLIHKGKLKEAVTRVKVIEKFEIDVPLGLHSTSRYSLLEIKPETGRFHQIRRHLAHIRHPILGDRPHGCSKQNRLWKENFGLVTMMLHAKDLKFTTSDCSKDMIHICASPSEDFQRTLGILKYSKWN